VEEDLARNDDDRDAAALERVTDRDLEYARKLFGNADELRVHTAFAKEFLRVRLLEVASSDLIARDVCGDREHRNAAPVCVEEPVDEMEIARPTTRRADRELAGYRGLSRGSERGGFLMPDVHPVDLSVAMQCVGEAVQRVAG
jgi:hypothetical protein